MRLVILGSRDFPCCEWKGLMLVDPVTMPPVWQRFSAQDIDIQGKALVFCSLVQGDNHMRFQPQPPVPLRYQLNISLPVQISHALVP